MRNRILTSLMLLAAAGNLSGCSDTVAFTYHGDEQAWKSARDAGRAAIARHQYQIAEAQFVKAVECARRIEASNPHHLSETLLDLGEVLQKEGKVDEAEKTYQEVIAVGQRVSSNKSSSELYRRLGRYTQATAWLNIGRIHDRNKDYKGAENAYKKGLQFNAGQNAMDPIVSALKTAYGDLLDKTGENPALARRMHEEATSVGDGILEGL